MTGTVHAEFQTYGGAPAKGTVTFGTNTADQQLRDTGGNVVYTGPRKFRLVDGELEVDLPATDDTAFAETDWAWWARIELDGCPPALRWFSLEDGTTVELADVDPEVVPGGAVQSGFVTLASLLGDLGSDSDVRAALDLAVSFLMESAATATETSLSASIAAALVDSGRRQLDALGTDVRVYLHYKNGAVYGQLEGFDTGDTSVTLPAGWRPVGTYKGVVYEGGTPDAVPLEIATNGVLVVNGGAAIGTAAGAFSYPIAAAPSLPYPGTAA